jgi:hypothetical protein
MPPVPEVLDQWATASLKANDGATNHYLHKVDITGNRRREVCLAVNLTRADNQLLRVSEALRNLQAEPESFVWSAVPGTGEARVWLIVNVEEVCFGNLITSFKKISGLHAISASAPGEALITALDAQQFPV